MRNLRMTFKLVSSALLVVVGFMSVPASAQNLPPAALPPKPERDENGVDLAGWGYSYEFNPISIGTPDQGGMSLSYHWPENRDSYAADLTVVDPSGNATAKAVATFGSNTGFFTNGSGIPSANDGVGNPGESLSLGPPYVYSMANGTIVEYTPPDEWYNYQNSSMYLCGKTVSMPNGEVLTFHIKAFYGTDKSENSWFCRVQSIVSNRGYQLKYQYASDAISDNMWGGWINRVKATLINNSYEYCDPDADNCDLLMDWPSVSINRSGFSETYSNNSGKIWKFNSRTLGGGVGAGDIQTPSSAAYNISYTWELYSPSTGKIGGDASRVKSVNINGKTWNYSYNWSSSSSLLHIVKPDGANSTYHVNRGSSTSEWEWPPIIDWMTDEKGGIHRYTYGNHALIEKSYSPEGDYQEVLYDNRGNVTQLVMHPKTGLGLSDIISSALYSETCGNRKICNKPISRTDARGGTTNYTYDAVHGGVLTEMGPAPSTGAARPLKLYTYVQKYAYIMNSGGSLVPAASPVWLPASETQCQTATGSSALVCATGADTVNTAITYKYGADGTANNLLLKGRVVTADGVSHRSCYGYDYKGNQIWQISPNAGLAVCP